MGAVTVLVLPQKLIGENFAKILLSDGKSYIFHKKHTENFVGRESYISKHAFSFVTKGLQKIQSDGGEHLTIQANEIGFLTRGMYTITDLIAGKNGFESYVFFFDESVIQKFLEEIKNRNIYPHKTESFRKWNISSQLKIFLDSIRSHNNPGKNFEDPFLTVKLLELLYLIAQKDNDVVYFSNRLLERKRKNLQTFMEENFDKPLQVDDYAYLSGRSISSFRRDFKRYYRTTPQQWLKERKLEKAYHLLKTDDITVTEAAYQVGYENISYFIKSFKLKYKLSPKQLKLQLNDKPQLINAY